MIDPASFDTFFFLTPTEKLLQKTVLMGAIGLGILLRLYGVRDQILLDDEWHAFNFVLNRPFSYVATHHGTGANSIPVNIAAWILLHGPGWSEIWVRLIPLFHGIAALVLLPLLVEKLWNGRVAAVFALLFAMSPCAIFYSRIARPYAMVLFWGTLSIFAILMRTRNDAKDAKWLSWLHGISAFLAIYHHLFSAVIVLASWPFLFFFKTPPRRELFHTGLFIVGASAIFLAPAIFANPWWTQSMGMDHVTVETFSGWIGLMTGTSSPYLHVAFGLLFIHGFLTLCRQCEQAQPALRMAAIIASSYAAFAVALVFSTQESIHVPIQVARYGIILLPMSQILVAISLVNLAGRVRFARLLPGLFVAALAFRSPLPLIYATPNNFAHHSAFQYSYEEPDWTRSRERELVPGLTMPGSRVPKVYDMLREMKDIEGVIEYPMIIGDHLDLHYFYQHVHGKRVVVGYRDDVNFSPMTPHEQWVYPNTPVDYVFSRVPVTLRSQLRFLSLTSVTDPAQLVCRFRNWALVIHKGNLLHEAYPGRFPEESLFYKPAVSLAARFRDDGAFKILEESDTILVLKIQGRNPP